MIELNGRGLTADEVDALHKGAQISLAEDALERVEASYLYLQERANDSKPLYGINTGFGYFAERVIPEDERRLLQKNIV